MSNKLSMSMYHYVRPIAGSRYPGIKGLELKQFIEQLDFFEDHFNIVSCDDVRDALYRGKSLPDNALMLTFDDGYLEHYTYVYPQLKKRGLPGFFSMPGRIMAERKLLDVNKIHFVVASTEIGDLVEFLRQRLPLLKNSDLPTFDELYRNVAKPSRFDNADTIFVKRLLQNVLPEDIRNDLVDELFSKYVGQSEESFVNELYMSMDQIEMMSKDGMEFGSHGYDHKWLGKIPDDEMRIDIAKSMDVFAHVLPLGWCMCFPYGSYTDAAIDCAKSYGAAMGVTVEARVAEIGVDSPMSLPRFDTNDFPPKSNRYAEL